MTTYRTGNHHGVTIVAEGDGARCGRPDHDCERGHLVAVVVDGSDGLDADGFAEHICERLNSPTPDVTYTRGAAEALAEVRRRLDAWGKLADIYAEFGPEDVAAIVLGILRDASAELGVDEKAAETGPASTMAAQDGSVVGRDNTGAPGRSEGRFWGEHPAHPTCIDVTNIRAGRMPGSEWICGAECPRGDA